MSPRKILRIILSTGILVMSWKPSWLWLVGSLVVSVILPLVVLVEVRSIQERRRDDQLL